MSKPRLGGSKRVAIGLLAGALAVFGLAIAPPAGAVADVTTDRVAGQTRFGTAGAACARAFPNGTGTVIVATARNFPDALAASSLAGANKACIFLTEVNEVPKETMDAITISKATKGIIVGGTNAVSTNAENQLKAKGLTVSRVAGNTRYGTAAAILNAITPGSVGGAATCIVASGEVAADALAAGPGAYRGDGTNPFGLLLVQRDSIPAETQAVLGKCKNIVIVGGTAAISDAVKAQLGTATGDTSVDRVAGTTRFSTATAIADYLINTLKTFGAPTTVLLANGLPPTETFSVDALVGGPLGGQLQAVILLVQLDSLGTDAQAWLDAHSNTITTILLLGGTAVISQAVADAADSAAQTTSNDQAGGGTSVTARPELQSASVVSTSSIGANPGTVVRFVFDEALTGAIPGQTGFHLYYFNGTVVNSGSAVVDSTNTKAALVTFPSLTTTASLANLSVATVDAASVADLSSITNPEGDAPLGGSTSSSAAAGITTAPDLVSVGNTRSSGLSNTLVDFTFDEAAYNGTPAGYQVVTVNGVDIECTFVAPGAGDTTFGNGTTVHTVNCPNSDPTAGALTTTNIARGYVDQDAVGDATGGTGNTNVLTAADVANAGNTSDPDLVSVTLQPDAKVGVTDVDQVLYTFDQPVTVNAATGAGWFVYTASAGEIQGNDTDEANIADAVRSTTNDTQVLVTFADNTLSNVVGASVEDSVVTAASGTPTANEEDEVGATPLTTSFTGGTTDAPDLTGVIITQGKDPFGTVTSIRATYIFDEDVDLATAGKLKLWAADGTVPSFNCAAAIEDDTTGNEALDNTVTCVGWASGTIPSLNAAVLGTVDDGAVNEEGASTLGNPEGAAVAGGTTGTPQA